jgi:uncharacterized protein YbbC (DUF1343 family)
MRHAAASMTALCLLFCQDALAAEAKPVASRTRLGSEVLAEGGFRELQGKRVGLLTNPSGANPRGLSTIDLLRNAAGVKLVALFAPEHGINADVPAGVEFHDARDTRTGLPVYSLYGPGPVRKPTAKMLQGLDALVYDIQDVGCRSYTFISTMGLAMEACASNGVEFVVLDRPNPLGGERIEGPVLDLRFRSLVGQWPIPYVYGLTPGEMARMINGEGWIAKPCRLTVVPLRHWRRDMVWRDTQLPWRPTSPKMPHADSPMHYVSTGLLGQIGGVSIGIGGEAPFQWVAAPWLKADAVVKALGARGLPGVEFRPLRARPTTGAFRDQNIEGAQILFTQPAHAPLMAINFHALEVVSRLGNRDLFAQMRKDPVKVSMFDKLLGTEETRRALEHGTPAARLVASWKADEQRFRERRRKYLLY